MTYSRPFNNITVTNKLESSLIYLNITRKELEQKNQYKDLDVLGDTVGIKKYIRGLIRKGKDKKEVITKTVEKFEVP